MTDFQEKEAIERARHIIEICGGAGKVAEIVGRAVSRVHSWTYERTRHGTGGMIPPRCQQELLAHAREAGLPLKPEHFFPPEPDEAETAA